MTTSWVGERRSWSARASANGLSNKVSHIVYSHHHADHLGASSLFGHNVVRVGHVETKRLLARDNDPSRPVPDITFDFSDREEFVREHRAAAAAGPRTGVGAAAARRRDRGRRARWAGPGLPRSTSELD